MSSRAVMSVVSLTLPLFEPESERLVSLGAILAGSLASPLPASALNGSVMGLSTQPLRAAATRMRLARFKPCALGRGNLKVLCLCVLARCSIAVLREAAGGARVRAHSPRARDLRAEHWASPRTQGRPEQEPFAAPQPSAAGPL